MAHWQASISGDGEGGPDLAELLAQFVEGARKSGRKVFKARVVFMGGVDLTDDEKKAKEAADAASSVPAVPGPEVPRIP